MKYAGINKKQSEWREKTKTAETTKLCNRQKTKGVVKGEGKTKAQQSIEHQIKCK